MLVLGSSGCKSYTSLSSWENICVRMTQLARGQISLPHRLSRGVEVRRPREVMAWMKTEILVEAIARMIEIIRVVHALVKAVV